MSNAVGIAILIVIIVAIVSVLLIADGISKALTGKGL